MNRKKPGVDADTGDEESNENGEFESEMGHNPFHCWWW
jgi:hypothetical protein